MTATLVYAIICGLGVAASVVVILASRHRYLVPLGAFPTLVAVAVFGLVAAMTSGGFRATVGEAAAAGSIASVIAFVGVSVILSRQDKQYHLNGSEDPVPA